MTTTMDISSFMNATCDACWEDQADCRQDKRLGFARSHASAGSLCSSQTMEVSTFSQRALGTFDAHGFNTVNEDSNDGFYASSADVSTASSDQPATSWLETDEGLQHAQEPHAATYTACAEMIRRHKLAEQPNVEQLSQLAGGGSLDDGSRMIVVSWLVEVAEEFGLQQETLHAAVALLDRFLSTSNGVPRCVLQLVAVGCIFLAAKQLEVHHPSVEQMVAVAAHSFTAADLLRVERILLDALDFNITTPTMYGFLHLLTQATLAVTHLASNSNTSRQQPSLGPAPAAAAAGPSPPMEVVVSLAMYVTELALLDQSCLAFQGSSLATAALLLAHLTLSGHCGTWPHVLAAAGMTEQQLQPELAALGRLHAAAAAPPTAQLAELLLPLKIKFGQDCWCRVAADVAPLGLQQ